MKNAINITAAILALGLVTFAILPGSGFGQDDRNSTQSIESLINKRLNKHGLLKGNTINVTVLDSLIKLDGTVSTLQQKGQAAHDAQTVEENYQIINNLLVAPVNISDADLIKNVRQRFHDNIFYSIFDWITVDVKNGEITLNGWVYEPWHKRQFEHQVERVPGVTKIINNITIEPVSLFDDGIRNRAARLIYDDSFFRPYSRYLVPPVHIIVTNGKVILEGSVESKYERNYAENTIISNTDAFDVINNLQVEEK